MAAVHKDQVAYSNNLMASLGGEIISVDAGIENTGKVRASPSLPGGGPKACSAIHTLLNEDKQVVGQYAGSNSTWELTPALLDLRRRFERLSQVGHHFCTCTPPN